MKLINKGNKKHKIFNDNLTLKIRCVNLYIVKTLNLWKKCKITIDLNSSKILFS